MPKPLPSTYLQPDETTLAAFRRHPLSIVDVAIVATALLAGGLVASAWARARFPEADQLVSLAVGAASVAYVWWLVALYWRVATSEYTVTDGRIYKAFGRLRYNILQTTYDKITDLHIRQSLAGRIWGFGTVRVQTAGTGLALHGVRQPFQVKQQVEAARSRFIGQLINEARRQPAKVASTEEAGEESRQMWHGTPSGAWLAASMVASVIAVTVGASMVAFGSVTERRTAIFGGALVAIAIARAWSYWLRYKYSAYEVTQRGVVVRRGWISRERVEATFAKVTDVTTNQDIPGRLLGYGSITINTAGSNQAPIVFTGVSDPERVKDQIDAVRRGSHG